MGNVVIIRLQGGLGNQLFQYAFGVYLSRLYKSSVYLDKFLLENHHVNDTPRQYELGAYTLSASPLKENERKKLKILNPSLMTRFLAINSIKFLNVRYINEEEYEEDRRSLYCDAIIVVQGFWQNINYVEQVHDVMRDLFYSYQTSNQSLKEIISKFVNTNSVAIHVRRGDYVSNAGAAKFHALCDMSYYKRAIEKIKAVVTAPTFYIFTDDPTWVDSQFQELNVNYEIISSSYLLNHHDELFAMAHCKHNIIANSSFSWWGAWANRNLDKFVIAPKIWHKSSNSPPPNLLPKEWQLI
jgi:Glycosyl transferase family 11